MFAIFENGGKQYKVSVGDVIQLEKFDSEDGSTIEFKQVLLTSDGDTTEVGLPFVTATITAKVIETGRGQKIRVVKQKSKKRYHKVQGHRQSYTEVEILSIGSAKAAPKKAAAKTVEKTEEVVEKKAPVKKVAPKKVAAKKEA